jgi:hypothetical protein
MTPCHICGNTIGPCEHMSAHLYPEDDMRRITALQLIDRYEAPEWIVRPLGDVMTDDDLAAELDGLAELGFSDAERHDGSVRGWGEHNAIVSFQAPDGSFLTYLARYEGTDQ